MKNKIPEIQIWNSFEEPINISEKNEGDLFSIEIKDTAKDLPKELEDEVQEAWEDACVEKKLIDNPILFLTAPLEKKPDSGRIVAQTNVRGFKYTYSFNRNPNFYDMTEVLRDYSLLSLSTHCHLVTKDNKLLFGTKRDQFNQISGFSGFPHAEEDSYERDGKRFLDIYGTILNRLEEEIGYLVRAVDSISTVGVVYVDTPGLRGIDSDYLIRLDESSTNAQRRFRESSQFERELYVVDFEPDKMVDFIRNIYSQGKQMSKYALGCSYAIMKSYFGKKESKKFLKTIQELGENISLFNKTDYFYKK